MSSIFFFPLKSNLAFSCGNTNGNTAAACVQKARVKLAGRGWALSHLLLIPFSRFQPEPEPKLPWLHGGVQRSLYLPITLAAYATTTPSFHHHNDL